MLCRNDYSSNCHVNYYEGMYLILKVMQLPEKDQILLNKQQLLARMDVSLGGRAAEEMIFGDDFVTTGTRCTIVFVYLLCF